MLIVLWRDLRVDTNFRFKHYNLDICLESEGNLNVIFRSHLSAQGSKLESDPGGHVLFSDSLNRFNQNNVISRLPCFACQKCLQNFTRFFSVPKHEMFKVDFCISSPSSPPLLCALLHPCSQPCLTKPTKQRMWQKHDPSLLRYHLHSSFFHIVTLTFSILH